MKKICIVLFSVFGLMGRAVAVGPDCGSLSVADIMQHAARLKTIDNSASEITELSAAHRKIVSDFHSLVRACPDRVQSVLQEYLDDRQDALIQKMVSYGKSFSNPPAIYMAYAEVVGAAHLRYVQGDRELSGVGASDAVTTGGGASGVRALGAGTSDAVSTAVVSSGAEPSAVSSRDVAAGSDCGTLSVADIMQHAARLKTIDNSVFEITELSAAHRQIVSDFHSLVRACPDRVQSVLQEYLDDRQDALIQKMVSYGKSFSNPPAIYVTYAEVVGAAHLRYVQGDHEVSGAGALSDLGSVGSESLVYSAALLWALNNSVGTALRGNKGFVERCYRGGDKLYLNNLAMACVEFMKGQSNVVEWCQGFVTAVVNKHNELGRYEPLSPELIEAVKLMIDVESDDSIVTSPL